MKKLFKVSLFVALILSNVFLAAGCWNYREIERLAIVAGVAIDKDSENGKVLLTVEVIDIHGGRDAKQTSKRIEGTGDTIFDAARNIIKLSGRKLYWSHNRVAIISQDIAREGVVPVLDWLNRDGETRMSLDILISKEKTAKELLEQQSITEEIRSNEIYHMLTSENSLSKAPRVEIYEFLNSLAAQGKSAVLPTASVTMNQGERTSELSGMAILKEDKLVGFLNSEDTKYYLFIVNKIKGGILVQKEETKDSIVNLSLEMFAHNTETKIKPIYENGKISMDIFVHLEVNIGENGGRENFINEVGREKLKKDTEESLKENIKRVIKKVQNNYGSDVFGFGNRLKSDMPNLWKNIEKDWGKIFKTLDVNVNVKLKIRNSGLVSKPIKIGD